MDTREELLDALEELCSKTIAEMVANNDASMLAKRILLTLIAIGSTTGKTSEKIEELVEELEEAVKHE